MRARFTRGCLASLLAVLVVGVVPAGAQTQPDPEAVLDHFRCYQPSPVGSPIGLLGLTDQFGPDSISSGFLFELCNPVQKSGIGGPPAPPLLNEDAHLVCYIHNTVPFQQRDVRVTNQFGVDTLRVIRPERLCAPASKSLGSPPPLGDIEQRLDHFRCYQASGTLAPPPVLLADQFGTQSAFLAPASLLCNPVEKKRSGFPTVVPRRPFAHLVCYPVSAGPLGASLRAATRDQFGTAQWFLSPDTGVAGQLCVPSLKELIAPPARVAQHFRAYRAVGRRATQLPVTLIDQFGPEEVRLGSVRLLMTPVAKQRGGKTEPIERPDEHLKCYGIVGAPANRTVTVSNQFTDGRVVRVNEPSHLCAPAAKERPPTKPGQPPADLNHYKCYAVARTPAVGETVGLSDQFGSDEVLVQRLIRLCNPVEKQREGHQPESPPHPTEHLACYQVREPAPFEQVTVITNDQFTLGETLRVTKPSTLCVPSEKTEEGGEV